MLKEYEILGDVLFDFLVRQVDLVQEPCTRAELLECGQRIFRSIAIIQQHTTAQFLVLDDQRVRDREERLRSFNRTVSHELKNRLAAAWGSRGHAKGRPDGKVRKRGNSIPEGRGTRTDS